VEQEVQTIHDSRAILPIPDTPRSPILCLPACRPASREPLRALFLALILVLVLVVPSFVSFSPSLGLPGPILRSLPAQSLPAHCCRHMPILWRGSNTDIGVRLRWNCFLLLRTGGWKAARPDPNDTRATGSSSELIRRSRHTASELCAALLSLKGQRSSYFSLPQPPLVFALLPAPSVFIPSQQEACSVSSCFAFCHSILSESSPRSTLPFSGDTRCSSMQTRLCMCASAFPERGEQSNRPRIKLKVA